MISSEKNNVIFARLEPNEDINRMLKKICKKHHIVFGVLISGIGQLKNIKLGYFKEKGNYLPELFDCPYELLSLSGNICKNNDDYVLHLHAVLSDKNKKTFGGHLIDGFVEVTNEIVILKTDLNVKKVEDESTGLMIPSI